MPEHSGDDFKVKRVRAGCNHERAKLLDFAGFDQPRLVAQGFQFSIIIPDFTHCASPITAVKEGNVSPIQAADNGTIPKAKQVTRKWRRQF